MQNSWTPLLTLNPEFVMYCFMFVCGNGWETLIYYQIPESPDLQLSLQGKEAFTFLQVLSDWSF